MVRSGSQMVDPRGPRVGSFCKGSAQSKANGLTSAIITQNTSSHIYFLVQGLEMLTRPYVLLWHYLGHVGRCKA
jgi:hypothetical protein